MSLRDEIAEVKRVALSYGRLPIQKRHKVLERLARLIRSHRADLILASDEDLKRETTLPEAKCKRLVLTEARIAEMVKGIREIIKLPDPLKLKSDFKKRSSGIRVSMQPIPIGLVAMIFEARPNVVIDVFALCFKAGNGCVLKGGHEATESTLALFKLVQQALQDSDIEAGGVYLVNSSDRELMKEMLRYDDLIDVVIPRGGEGLIQFVTESTRIPVLRHAKGVCHLFIEKSCNLARALKVVVNAKVQAPATCNALECLLIDQELPTERIRRFLEKVHEEGIELRGCEHTKAILGSDLFSSKIPDWNREHLDLVLNCRLVRNLEDACDHIARFGSNHTDAILTESKKMWEAFRARVFSSCVLWNATTRFNDGFQLGLGAELGINTTKLHAYGPMGLEALTVRRFVVEGNYSLRR